MKTFQECIERVEESTFASSVFRAFAEGWKNSAGYEAEVDYLRFFEHEYGCSGICDEVLFSFSLSTELGRPKTCYKNIKDDVRDSMWWLGVAATGCGLELFILLIFQYCLWSKY